MSRSSSSGTPIATTPKAARLAPKSCMQSSKHSPQMSLKQRIHHPCCLRCLLRTPAVDPFSWGHRVALMSSKTIMWWNFESRERSSGVKAAVAERLMLEPAREMFLAYMKASLLCSTGIFSINVSVV
ncbi:hypothetical protein ACSS6W_000466 [Trichoderma asperelloides]